MEGERRNVEDPGGRREGYMYLYVKVGHQQKKIFVNDHV